MVLALVVLELDQACPAQVCLDQVAQPATEVVLADPDQVGRSEISAWVADPDQVGRSEISAWVADPDDPAVQLVISVCSEISAAGQADRVALDCQVAAQQALSAADLDQETFLACLVGERVQEAPAPPIDSGQTIM